jgi:DNA-binding response OmpR family regulator
MKRILVVDDEVDILGVIKIILERKNFIVYTIAKWQDITTAIKTFNPDLMLLDVSLGGADGRVICKQLKTHPNGGNLKIILFSAMLGVETTFSETGADAFIAKPFETSKLIETIHETLEKN